MTQDSFYMLDNQVVINCLNSAIDAHKNWLNTLKDIAQTGELKALQTDCTKCGFGHFYYTFRPLNSKVKPLWDALDSKHKEFHSYGDEMINVINSGDTDEYKLQQIYKKANDCSNELLSDFQTIVQIIGTLTRDNISVFEQMSQA